MKSQTQAVVLVVVVATLVGGITFLRQMNIPLMGGKPPDTKPVVAPKVNFVTLVAEPTAAESGQEGHHDFWFSNAESKPVRLTVKATSCTCSKVRVGFLSADEWADAQRRIEALPACQVLTARQGTIDWTALANLGLVEEAPNWREVQKEQSVTVPAAAAPDRPTWGIVRVVWKTEKKGAQRLTADLEDDAGTPYTLEAAVFFMPPLYVLPDALSVPEDIQAGSQEKQTVSLFCWSSTRAHFRLDARETSNHPCFVCTSVPLSGAELQGVVTKLQQSLKSDQPPPPPTAVGYRVTVDVYERNKGQQLDLGPFRHTIELTVDGDQTYVVPVRGTVRGEIRVVSATGVNFVPFKASRGSSKEVVLESLTPGLVLKPEYQFPDYLKVDLTKVNDEAAGRSRWTLKVQVPPHRPPGPLPEDSVVVLKIEGTTSRHVRIPVAGVAEAN